MEIVKVVVDADTWVSTFSLPSDDLFKDSLYDSTSDIDLTIYYAYPDSDR